jgi:hypothetical protein
MPTGDEYRVKAADINAQAHREKNWRLRCELKNLALAYLRLADQADRNALSDVVYETPRADQPNVQQQQQSQTKPIDDAGTK